MIVARGATTRWPRPARSLISTNRFSTKWHAPNWIASRGFMFCRRPDMASPGTNYTTDGDGKKLDATLIPNRFDRLVLLTDWVQ